jgi:flagellar basal body-associated protein FliL
MGKSNLIFLVLLISVLVLATLMLALGFSSNVLGGEPQELYFQSPEGTTQPEEGYVTALIDPWTTVTVTVESDRDVEVFFFSSTYRGGKVIDTPDNGTVIRDERLVSGEKSERVGTNVVLSDFTSVTNQYMVDVVEPDTQIPSDADYTIRIEGDTTANRFLFFMSLILLGLFAIMMVYRRVSLKEERSEVKDARPPYAGVYQEDRNRPPPAPMAPPPVPVMPTHYEPPPPQPPYLPQPSAVAPAAPAAPAYQVPEPMAAPVAVPPPVAVAPAPPPAAPAPAPAPAGVPQPLSRVRCSTCQSIVPVYTNERPTPIECPTCGKKGMIR